MCVLGAATNAVRDQVMRHNPNSALHNAAYINEKVKFDVQSAFLERPSKHGLLRALTHMSLTRDPRAPKSVADVPEAVFEALPADPEIVELEERRELLKDGAYQIRGTSVEDEVRSLTAEIHKRKVKRQSIIFEEFRAEYFRLRPKEDIEKQSRGEAEEQYVEPVVQHQIAERTELADLICSFSTDLTLQEIPQRRVRAINLMTALCYKREVPRRCPLRVTPPKETPTKQESPAPEPFPLVCMKTQCPFCIGDEAKTYEKRISTFCRPSKMMDHVERIHLRGVSTDQTIPCPHPVCKSCGLVLNNLMHFKNHVQTVHGISLRA